MTNLSRALAPFAGVKLISSLAAPSAAAARPARPAARPAAHPGPRPAAGSAEIITLPLKPTLPPGQRLCGAKTPAGLGYTMLRPATGAKPTEADFVLVNYIGYLAATGAVFDQGMRSPFPVNGVIPGFSKGLQMLAKTGIARFCIPAAMGYGAQGSGPIPANSDLVFQVELIDFKTAAEVDAMRAAQAQSTDAQSAEPSTPKAPPAPTP